MLFNSIEFALFLPVVFVLYWFVTQKGLRLQNALLIAASYFFYAWWDWRFLGLIVFSSSLDFWVGLRLAKTNKLNSRKGLLLLSILVNLGFLGFFKYFNFFAESFADAFTLLGKTMDPARLEIILPVGISFYTFQTLSYTIDVYRRKMEPTKDVLSFFAFVSFFPQLVAGPIERATNLLPQFDKERSFEYSAAVNGLRQVLWGLFKKVVIADNCAEIVDMAFADPSGHSGSNLLIGVLFFSFQIYGDFSGYSDMAIGMARLFGFNLKKNFAFPYFSRNIGEFWRRWHISLSTWFRDYLYIPLGGSRGSRVMQIRNVLIVFLVSGFWHGANWTFIVWGGVHALYFIPLVLLNRNRRYLKDITNTKTITWFKTGTQILVTFGLVTLAWIFFRAETLTHSIEYFEGLFSSSLWEVPTIINDLSSKLLVGFILFFIGIEWWGRRDEYAIETLWVDKPKWFQFGFYYSLTMIVFLFGGKAQEFIYFQF